MKKTTQKNYKIRARVYYTNTLCDYITINVISIDSEVAIHSAKYYLNERYPSYEILSLKLKED